MDLFIVKSKKVESFYPLHFFRKIADLRTGILTNRKRYSAIYNAQPVFIDEIPEKLTKGLYFFENFINYEKINAGDNTILVNNGEIVGYYIISPIRKDEIQESVTVEGFKLNYGFDIIKFLPHTILKDFKLLDKHRLTDGFDFSGNEKDIYIGENVNIIGKTYLNADSGPIYIDDDVTFKGVNFIEGPCYIGKSSIVDSAKIRPGCSFGKVNRISGEIEHSLFLDYVNKHHDGFIGHSIVGDWVNLGALTTNSDLKNNYHNVKMVINGKTIDTGMLKMGTLIGDFSKTGIGTLINTGTVMGISCNIFGGNVTDKFYPSFSWGNSNTIYSFEKAIDTIRITMGRRDVNLNDKTVEILRNVYKKERG